MTSDVASLPREPDILIGMITELRDENDKLRAMLATLKRTLFGARSEKFDADAGQLPLELEDLSATSTEPKPEGAAKPQGRDQTTRPKPVRNIGGLPKHLPREEVVIEPAIDACPCCLGTLHRIGEDVSEMLDIVPAIIRVKRIRRPRYGCRACESAVVQAPAPLRPVEGGLPTAALLAHVAVSKFAWHLPLHRQTQMLAGQGIDLDRSTLVHWIERAAWWLKPLHMLLLEHVMSATKIFCDDTRCRCWIIRGGERGSGDYGATRWMTGRGKVPRIRRWSTSTRKTAAPATSGIISAGSAACSRSMAIPVTIIWPNRVVPPARSRSPTAWRMLGGSSSTCTNVRRMRSPRKRCTGLARFMPSRRVSEAAPPKSASPSVRLRQSR